MVVEKDYWIMHGLWGLQAQGFVFELKGGTSLSKGFGVIHRFSEDIDIRIEPPADMDVKTGRNQDKSAHIAWSSSAGSSGNGVQIPATGCGEGRKRIEAKTHERSPTF